MEWVIKRLLSLKNYLKLIEQNPQELGGQNCQKLRKNYMSWM